MTFATSVMENLRKAEMVVREEEVLNSVSLLGEIPRAERGLALDRLRRAIQKAMDAVKETM